VDPRAGTVEGAATMRAERITSGPLALDAVGLDVHSVVVDGAAVQPLPGVGRLLVPVPADDNAVTVVIRWTAEPQTGLHFRGDGPDRHVAFFSQGEESDHRHWMPLVDHPSERFTTTTALTVPEGLVAFATGEPLGSASTRPGWRTWRFALDRPIPAYAFAIAAGEWRTVDVDGPVPLTLAAGREVPEALLRERLSEVGGMLTWLASTFDEPHPWGRYRQVAVSRFLYGAMENPTLVVLADGVLLRSTDRGRRHVLAHEAVHQWFGNLVTPIAWRDLWISEGFAEYFEARWQASREGEDRFAARVDAWSGSAGGPALAPRAWSEGADHAGYGAVYARGAAVLHALSVSMGDTAFLGAVRDLLDAHRDASISTAEVQRVFERRAGRDLGPFFEGWVHRGGGPEVSTSWSWSDGTLTVEIVQADGGTWSSPIQVEVGGAVVQRRPLWLLPGTQRLLVDLPEPPRWVAVDPDGGVIAHWKHSQSGDAWRAAATESPTALVRRRALAWLGDHADDAGRAVLEAAAATGPQDRRIAALAALGAARAPSPSLDAALGDADAEIRRAAADGLGRLPPDPGAAASLRRALRDSDDRVRAAALAALAVHDAGDALDAARRTLTAALSSAVAAERDDSSAAARVLGDHGTAADLDRLRPALAPSRARSLRHAAAWAVARLVNRHDGDGREAASRALWPMLADRDLRSRETAVAVLGEVGSTASGAALRALAARTTLPGLSDRAREAAAACEGRRDGAPSKPDDAALRERLDALKERMSRLEAWR
jgi:aminopeptidase N